MCGGHMFEWAGGGMSVGGSRVFSMSTSQEPTPFAQGPSPSHRTSPSEYNVSAAQSAKVALKDGAEKPTFKLADAQWLRAQRAGIASAADLVQYQQKLQRASEGFARSQGHGVGRAIALTIAAVLIAIIGIALGIVIMEFAGEWIASMEEN